jgi:ubiquinone/menaquinone biosynthesis C-methylase UbiE
LPYGKILRQIFHGVDLKVEDLFLLEQYQIDTLKSRVPEQEFAAVMFAFPHIKSFLKNKHPPFIEYIQKVQGKHSPAKNKKELTEFCDRLLWEIAEMTIYNKYPEIYDTRVTLGWDFKDITSVVSLKDKIVIDAGAGTGRVAFKAVKDASMVFAIEPCTSLRRFIRKKAIKNNITNLFVIGGFLHDIPLPQDYVDVLITSNAIGWKLEDELKEIERIVKPGGYAIHLLSSRNTKDPYKEQLTKPEWQYNYSEYKNKEDTVRKYWKQRAQK